MKTNNFDPPLPPEYPCCLFCDYPLENKGFSNFDDWVCTNPECEHSDCYQEPEKIDEHLDDPDWVPF
jgi:hypothetical protein